MSKKCGQCGKTKDNFKVFEWSNGEKEEMCRKCFFELMDLKITEQLFDFKIKESKKRRGLL